MKNEKTLKDLFADRDFRLSTNIEIILYRLLEDSGKSKGDILIGKYDDIIVVAKDRIFEQINKNC